MSGCRCGSRNCQTWTGHNLDGTDWPTTLNYTIRMKGIFNTERIEPMDGQLVPHDNFGTVYEEFMKLQWVVDASFINITTGKPLEQKLTFQEFPYYRRMENKVIALICMLLIVLCYISPLLVFVFLVCRLLEERASGIQELTKMVGVPSHLLGISHFLNVLPAGLLFAIFGTIVLKVTANPFIPNTNGIYIFILLILHYVALVSMAFACSYLAKGTQYSITIALFAYAALGMPALLVSKYSLPRALVYLAGLLPHKPMVWFWNDVRASEEFDSGVTTGTLLKSYITDSAPVLISYVMLILQTAIFFSLTWYLNLVRPGKYGQALPWLFMFKRSYWSKNEVIPDDSSESSDTELMDRSPKTSYGEYQYFEKPEQDLDVGIKIVNVSKVYPDQVALDKVTLDVYKNEITVLLGHNGAGKTTLMSIITGMIGATRGSVYVNGLSTTSQLDMVRRHLGLCPQHNLFFSDLTVLEHVMFFTLLKGTTYKKALMSSKELLNDLGLRDKERNKSSELSGGMKRRLQLACALAGDADVLVLDEPTSGLDVETRRSLWDLLLGLRGSRTVLVSTHFMEEAEALGDRVAALHRGRLACHATPMHLKRAVGTGYRLSVTTEGTPMESKVTALVQKHIPSATIKDQAMNSLTYSLPANESSKFEQLFSDLEDKRYELKINSMGVGISTLEEVFLKLCSDVDTSWKNLEQNGNGTLNETPQYVKHTGFALYKRQLWALLKRQARYIISKKHSFFILQVVMPIFFLCGFTYLFNNDVLETEPVNPSRTLDLDLYNYRDDRRVLYNADDVTALAQTYPKVQFERSSDIYEGILNYAKKDVWDYNKYLFGLEYNDTDAKVWFTTTLRHAAPVALSSLANALAAARGTARVSTAVWPLHSDRQWQLRQAVVRDAKAHYTAILWAVSCIFVILSTSINALSLVCKERVWGSRHALVMSGAAPELHWGATLLSHALQSALLLALPLLLAAAALDTDRTIDQPAFIFSFLLVLMLGCVAFFSFMYVVSLKFDERGAGGFLAAYVIVFCFITPLIQTASDILHDEESSNGFGWVLLQLSLYCTPPHALMMAAARCVSVARLNALCTLNRDRCPAPAVFDNGFDTDACCAGRAPRCYMCIDDYAPGKEMIILAVQFVVFMTLVVLSGRGVWARAWGAAAVNVRYRAGVELAPAPDPAAGPAPDPVRAAAEYVGHAINLAPNRQDAMLVHDVHKNYFKVFGKSCNAVRGVSFAVKKGECFGLLGVNGAGKSTTFKMMTAEECPTRGNIFANGYHLDRNPGPYLRTLGYCPQFHGLDRFLSGQQNLELLLTMRGLSGQDARKEADSWIGILGLQHVRERALGSYSGGSARRLGAGAALAAGGALVLLDEPTAGVDVAARRRLWAAVARARTQGRSLLLSSHSMDETEALCGAIGIMSRGRLCALGSAPELRARHAAGHAVLLQLARPARAARAAPASDQVDTSKSQIDELKVTLNNTFVGTVKDEHQTMLRYHINDPMRYSELFEKLEQLKQQYPNLVVDYSVTETTLEEVFLAFAKESHSQTV
ncbi:ATP-binding cassette sub-family A member 3 isoform X2 [Manduca sexta]|uniref:ATP-binding cassette sub-family A member 3 isoform X2 n=1 Tax=Manduca sexta TaxID=7130 RepID=UPI001890171F|nr:ATP-binding cassette sub-family A member 3 isoform X2 [Manduca sexta]